METPNHIPVSLPPTAAQVDAIKAAGPGAVVQHVRAKTPAGRRELVAALGRAGVPAKTLRTLGWSSIVGEPTGKGKPAETPEVEPPARVESPKRSRPKVAVEPSAALE